MVVAVDLFLTKVLSTPCAYSLGYGYDGQAQALDGWPGDLLILLGQ